jgi:hypothetical protein
VNHLSYSAIRLSDWSMCFFSRMSIVSRSTSRFSRVLRDSILYFESDSAPLILRCPWYPSLMSGPDTCLPQHLENFEWINHLVIQFLEGSLRLHILDRQSNLLSHLKLSLHTMPVRKFLLTLLRSNQILSDKLLNDFHFDLNIRDYTSLQSLFSDLFFLFICISLIRIKTHARFKFIVD